MCRYKWIGFHPDSWYWWGGVLYILGNLQYNIASTCSFAHNFPSQYEKWSADTVKWLVTVMYTSGGACYLLAGLFYVLTDTGPKFWKGKLNVRSYVCTSASRWILCCGTCSLCNYSPCLLHPVSNCHSSCISHLACCHSSCFILHVAIHLASLSAAPA